MTDFGDLSTTDLAKRINDEYAVILESERTNLQKALAIGEKLKALRPRIAPEHGEWQAKLKVYCPKISYETATLYVRLWDKRDELETAATAKSVRTTDLTIEEARKLLAKPKPDNANKSGKAGKVAKAGIEPGNEPDSTNEEEVGKEWLKALAPDDLITWLRAIHDTDYLKELSAGLARALTPPRPPQAPTSVVGIERPVTNPG
jgi:hypothetical protein